MNRKLHRVLDDIQKTEEKIAAWQEQLRNLNTQREMLENEEIIKSIRSLKLEKRELLAVLEGLQDGKAVIVGEHGTMERPGREGGMETAGQPEESENMVPELSAGVMALENSEEREGLENEA